MVRRLAERDVLKLVAQDSRNLGIALVETLHGEADRLSGHEEAEDVLERIHLRPGPPPEKGAGPGPLDVADHGQGTPLGVSEQAPRQVGDKRVRRERWRPQECLVREVVYGR